MDQMSLFMLLEEADQAACVAANPKRFDELVPGDYVETWFADGWHWTGWIVARHRDHYTVEPDWREHRSGLREPAPPWQESQGIRFRWFHPQLTQAWGWVRHDADHVLHPTPGEMADWLRTRLAAVQPSEASMVCTYARFLWPNEQRQLLDALYLDAMLARWPDIHVYLQDKHLTRFSLPKAVKHQIRPVVSLDPEARLAALRAVHWNAQGDHATHLALRGSAAALYERHWMLRTDDPAVLVRLAEGCGYGGGVCDHPVSLLAVTP